MNKLLLAVLIACCTSASATVLTFDDIPAGLSPIPDGYGGFTWNTDALTNVYSRSDIQTNNLSGGYVTGITSGTQAVSNASGDVPITISLAPGGSNSTFTFNGGNFTAASGAEALNFVGSVNGNAVYASPFYTITQGGPLAVTLNFAGIDTLQIYSSGADTRFIMDDFNFDGGNAGSGGGNPGNPVPEPFSLSLMGLGLAALGAARRRKD
jgi:hypothetical protein